ncbi:hypothetical protein ID866_12669 [Astraeus odoratus]|nr:hypothetical protein ID866_12669 [Astraeus odoratus]
MQTQLPRLS